MSLFYVQFLSDVDLKHVRGKTNIKSSVKIKRLYNRRTDIYTKFYSQDRSIFMHLSTVKNNKNDTILRVMK